MKQQPKLELAVQFPNERGEFLRGVLHSPEFDDESRKKAIVIFPNGGVMGCEGDYRAHVTIARHLARSGYYVLRFSPSGLGYSDGDIPNCRQKSLYVQIEYGLFVADIRAAVQFAKTIESFSSITLSGICGGAISAFLAAAELKEVQYVIPIGIPVLLDNDDLNYEDRLPADRAKLRLKIYYDKLFSPMAWVRLLTKRSDIRSIKSAILGLLRPKGAYISTGNEKGKFAENPNFFKAARRIFKTQKKVLFVFGDADGFWWEFEKIFLKKYYAGVKDAPFDLYRSPEANHMLSLPEMQVDVAQAMLAWMNKHHV
jgi:pimeloyl-ACP methyl ester carboxylesterase